jgi:mannobiose 2-epimerase
MTAVSPAPLPTLAAVEAALRRHVLDAWFPRCLDRVHGGFLCDFDRAWAPAGEHDKQIEFQARQTLLAATACERYSDMPILREAALHGFRCLRDTLWDREAGGWFHRVDRAGAPLESGTKHVHGFAYAIAACAAVFSATGDGRALDLARDGFAWLEHCAHDARHGGYVEFFDRSARPIVARGDHGWADALDTIGTPLGCKDANVVTDLLQSFNLLARAWPEPRVAERLAELRDIVVRRLMAPTGALHFLCLADWSPLPGLQRFGYAFQGAHRLLASSDRIGDRASSLDAARRLLACAFDLGADPEHGGYFVAGPGSPAFAVDGVDMVVRRKPWWIQMEALSALVAMLGADPEFPGLRDRLADQWRYVTRHLFDERDGGTFTLALDDPADAAHGADLGPLPAAWVNKGNVWKDGSHEGHALMTLAAFLSGRGASGASSPLRDGGRG